MVSLFSVLVMCNPKTAHSMKRRRKTNGKQLNVCDLTSELGAQIPIKPNKNKTKTGEIHTLTDGGFRGPTPTILETLGTRGGYID